MAIPFLELQQADQISACTLSLSLGLLSQPNTIEQFLQFHQQCMQMDEVVLSFYQEPYLWHYADGQLHAIESHTFDTGFNNFLVSESAKHTRAIQSNALWDLVQLLQTQAQSVIAFHLYDSNQKAIGYVIVYDVKNKEIREQQKQLLYTYHASFIQQLELKQRYEELKILYEQEANLNFNKTKFFSIISHDLRAPFHGLLGFSEILAKERHSLDESSIQNITDYLYETSQSTYNLLESLLTWSMAENGRIIYQPIYFQLCLVTQTVFKTLEGLALKKNIQLLADIDENLQVYADRNMISSVIQNLLANALKFTPTDGTGKVEIRAYAQDNHIVIQIQDTGMGMTEAQQKYVSQPSVTVSVKGTAGEKGAGLGLALCRRFIDLNHGKIAVSSQLGQGTTFEVILPARAEQVEQQSILLKSRAKSA